MLCLAKTSPHTRVGGDDYVSRMKRRIIGKICLIAAFLSLVLAVLTHLYSRDESNNSVSTANSVTQALATEPLIISTPDVAAPPSRKPTDVASDSSAGAADQFRPNPQSSLLHDAEELVKQNQPDAALAKLDAYIEEEPADAAGYALRGTIYAQRKIWDRAKSDFEAGLRFQPGSIQIKFDLGQLEFAQKKYDAARIYFMDLEQDPNAGDLAAYKVFLCDLYGGHQDMATKELAAFNEAGSNASYYFANAVWSLAHGKKDEANGWLNSAHNIYSPSKFSLYEEGLIGLGDSEGSGEHSSPAPESAEPR